MRAFVQAAGARYWPGDIHPADMAPDTALSLSALGRHWVDVTLPAPYSHLGVAGKLWVDAACIMPGGGDAFSRCDWYLAAFSYLSGIAEWHHELAHGPAHSFAFRLKTIPARCFDHAWANRILLLLRAMEAQRRGQSETELFGPLPDAEIRVTHDVDALDKTGPIRIKQSTFECFTMLRSLLQGKPRHAVAAFTRALRMAFITPAYYQLDTMADLVAAHGLRSSFHLHVPPRQRSLKRWLMNPGYRIEDARLKAFVAARSTDGFGFGLHPSFESWQDAVPLREARAGMEAALGIAPTQVRQHWLRFSWRDTWRAQAEAGLTDDCTLGFNDRTGFRAGAALNYTPWDFVAGHPHRLQSCPMILMDSQFYSYQDMSDGERQSAIAALIDEVRAVHGVASVLWHPHTLSADYGWQQGFQDLLTCITRP